MLLDTQFSSSEVDDVLSTLGMDGGQLDYIFIGHMHFDHTGDCVGCAPFWEIAAEQNATVVGPSRACLQTFDGTPCVPLFAGNAPIDIELPGSGLKITAIPVAHSTGDRGPPGGTPDPFAYLFEFPGEEESPITLLYGDSNRYDGISYTERNLDYTGLLLEAVEPYRTNGITMWTFMEWMQDTPEYWEEWAEIINPKAFGNHHTGSGVQAYFPRLRTPFSGDPYGGSTWLREYFGGEGSGRFSNTTLLLFDDFFSTHLISSNEPPRLVERGYASRFRNKQLN